MRKTALILTIMPIAKIFDAQLVTNDFNVSDSFSNASAVLMEMPNTPDNFECDANLQLEMGNITQKNRVIELNETYVADTIRVFPIPQEFQDINFSMHLTLVPTIPVTCRLYAISPLYTLADVKDDTSAILSDTQTIINLIGDLQTAIENCGDDGSSQTLLQWIINILISLLAGGGVEPILPPGTDLPALPSGGTEMLPLLYS